MVSFVASELFAIAMIVVVISLFMNEMDIIVQIMSKMDIIVQWATILSPIIAVLIACWTVWSSSKDTAKKMAALEESTTKQVESVKQLAKILIKTNQTQIGIELEDTMTKEKQVLKKRWDHVNREYGANGIPVEVGVAGDFYRKREEKDKNFEYESEFYEKRRKSLMRFQGQLNELTKELEEM